MPPETQRIRPTPIDRYLGNPHKGLCTFQHFNGDPLFPDNKPSEEGPTSFPPRVSAGVIDGYLPTTVAYCRWFWEKLEPQENKYDFSLIDQSLEVCKERGQTLAVRLMALGGASQPQLPSWYVDTYPTNEWKVPWSGNKPIRVPDYEEGSYLKKWLDLHRAFGERYDGNPLIECVDIAYIGPWGEGGGGADCTNTDTYAKAYQEAMPNTLQVALFGGNQLASGVKHGSGWRIDCFGDNSCGCAKGDEYTENHLGYDHMHDVYPVHMIRSGVQDAWQQAPVFLETCHNPHHWYQEERDIDFILQQGLKYHSTYFMPKQCRLPDEWIPRFKSFLKHLGYRFVFRQATINRNLKANETLSFLAWIENIGVAPLYHQYTFALRFRQGSDEWIQELSHINPSTWQPGDTLIDEDIQLPKELKPGYVRLAAGLITSGERDASIRFAVKEQFNNAWVDLQGFEIISD